MSVQFLSTPVEYLKGVGPKRAELLKRELGIFTFEDLLYYFPFRYIDRSKFFKVSEINDDSTYYQLKGKIYGLQKIGKTRTTRLLATFRDDTGEIELVWFQGFRWIIDKLLPNIEYIVFGKPNYFNGKYNIPHPEIEPVLTQNQDLSVGLRPFYNSSEKLKNKGLDSKGIGKLTRNLIMRIPQDIKETLPEEIIKHLKFISCKDALINIHHPKNQELLSRAVFRLKFEELFYLQLKFLKIKYLRAKKSDGYKFPVVGDYLNDFYKNHLPFELTNAQKRVIKEIRIDFGSGKQMNRLLQGDVGSGKTLVALMCMLIALDNNFQACIMAPTEILAEQHFRTLKKMLQNMDVKIDLLTGSVKTARRKIIHQELENGNLQILIGTHALIEETVKFKNLGFVVIDEQHRFGVEQRAKLWKKSKIPPHMLVMTATPIPRTLAMAYFSDLNLSVIDEMPPGRKSVQTYHYFDNRRMQVFSFLKKQIDAGQQVYIVYPLINESETLDLKDLMDGYESISREFPLPDYSISIVHGKMKSENKDYEMQRFIKGETQIMVATTVIEVGVDVANASVMVIENAERFGLSQLHQLRGRVGRGADQSFCVLMTGNKLTSEAKKRIETMTRTSDGFIIAEEDMKIRGPGDMYGTQQSGIPELKLADITKDEKLLKLANELANNVLKDDPLLQKQKNQILVHRLNQLDTSHSDLSRIS